MTAYLPPVQRRVTGWYSDQDGDMWQPVIQMDRLLSSLQIWFATEAECDQFIHDDLIPVAGWYYGGGK